MQATVVDLRYRMREVLRALSRREKVRLLYHGKIKGTIIPSSRKKRQKVKEHPFFGMLRQDKRRVSDVMKEIRGDRYNDL